MMVYEIIPYLYPKQAFFSAHFSMLNLSTTNFDQPSKVESALETSRIGPETKTEMFTLNNLAKGLTNHLEKNTSNITIYLNIIVAHGLWQMFTLNI